MEPMYRGIPFSPQTTLTDSIGASDTVIPVADASVFPDPPNYATIGIDADGETISYAAKAGNALSGCTRAVEGTPKSWVSGSVIARNFTAKDLESLQKNLREVGRGVQSSWSQNNPDEANFIIGKTHWKEPGAVTSVLLDEAVKFSGKIPSVKLLPDLAYGIEVGETYFIVWDGVEYECVAKLNELGEVIVGNQYLVDKINQTGEPFCLLSQDGDRFFAHRNSREEKTIPIKIQTRDGVVYHPLIPEYIPGGVPYAETAAVGQTVVVSEVDENGKPTKWVARDAGGGGGSGGASVQADWGENDETKLSYVKHRTHWKEAAAPTVFVEEENAAFAGKSRSFIFKDFFPYRKDIIGKTFEATWKGEVYTMQGEAYADYAVVGNKGLAFASEEDTGEPCCFVFEFNSATHDKSDVVVVYRTPGQGERISYKLARIEPDIYHKLDLGYLPVNERKTITWDGEVKDGDVVIEQMTGADKHMRHIKVSDLTPEIEDVMGGVIWCQHKYAIDTIGNVSVKEHAIADTAWGEGFAIFYNQIAGSDAGIPDEISERGEVVVIHSPSDIAAALGVVPGIYFGFTSSLAITKLSFGKENRIDSGVMPDGYGRVTKSVELLPETTFADGMIVPTNSITLTPYKSYRVVFGGVTYYATALPLIVEGMLMGYGIGVDGNGIFSTKNVPVQIMNIFPEYVDLVGAECVIQMKHAVFVNQTTISIWEDTYEPIAPIANPRLIVTIVEISDDGKGSYDASVDKQISEIFEAVAQGRDVEMRLRCVIPTGKTIMLILRADSFYEDTITFCSANNPSGIRTVVSLDEIRDSTISVKLPEGYSPMISGTNE